MPGFEVIGAEERRAVNEVFDDGGILFAHGFDAMRKGRFRVREFERAFAERMGVRYAQAVNSGTAAIKVALVALGVRPGDEVITQAFNFVATIEAIIDLGATPILVNVDDTLNMDPALLEAAITPKTRAIVPVHMLGVAADLSRILPIAKAHNLPVLDDNCESIGAEWDGKMLGVQANAAAFSFDFGKTITTGEGGMVTTDDQEIYKLASEYHDHGHENNPAFPRGRDTRRIAGFNYRMTELQAAVGLAQLQKLSAIVARNREVCAIFEKAMTGIDGITLRRVPRQCVPLCDCLIFETPSAEQATAFAARMDQAKLGTKNLPSAFEWHFAGFWDHIFNRFGMTKESLWAHTRPSYERLARCIAIPVMVKYTDERAREIGETLQQIATDVVVPVA
jgi:8-amino-3,8-dideoxy-alpha-D-manno-octulosonate transaminase